MEDKEIRTFRAELRAEGDGQPVIEGLAAVYNSVSEDLGGWRELIEPGFFRDVLQNDCRGLFNHDANYVLGRTRSKTLELSDTEQGLGSRMVPPDTQWARDLLVSMKRGDIDQMSFAFRVKKGGSEWVERDDGSILRRLLPGGCERLYDVSVVTEPAYPQTSAFARSEFNEFRSRMSAGQEEATETGTTQEGDPGDGEGNPDEGLQERVRNVRELELRRLELLEMENLIPGE